MGAVCPPCLCDSQTGFLALTHLSRGALGALSGSAAVENVKMACASKSHHLEDFLHCWENATMLAPGRLSPKDQTFLTHFPDLRTDTK